MKILHSAESIPLRQKELAFLTLLFYPKDGLQALVSLYLRASMNVETNYIHTACLPTHPLLRVT